MALSGEKVVGFLFFFFLVPVAYCSSLSFTAEQSLPVEAEWSEGSSCAVHSRQPGLVSH